MKKMRKHKIVLFLLAVSLLSGCSQVNDRVNNWVEEKGLEKAGLENTEEYKKAQEYQSKKEYTFGEDGLAVMDFSEEAVPAIAPIAGIHVTAAENSNLDVKYYSDEARTQEISDIGSAGFNKNDVIYVSAKPKDEENKLYEFSEIVVYDIGENGEKNNAVNGMWDSENSLIRIPEDYNGSELAIEPLGAYSNSKATFEAYCSDGTTKTPVDCDWTLDDSTYNSGSAELKPTETHKITAGFDKDKYYYVSSDESSGFEDTRNVTENNVIFNNVILNDKESKFVIKLHKLIDCRIDIKDKDVVSVSVNGGDSETLSDAKDFGRLKVGDKITLELNDGYKAECMQFAAQSTETINGKTKVVFLIPEMSESVKIMVVKSSDEIYHYQGISFEHAVMTVTENDTKYVLQPDDAISGSTEVTVKIIPDEGYIIEGPGLLGIFKSEMNTYEESMTYSQYQKKRNDLITDYDIKQK